MPYRHLLEFTFTSIFVAIPELHKNCLQPLQRLEAIKLAVALASYNHPQWFERGSIPRRSILLTLDRQFHSFEGSQDYGPYDSRL